jgi:hypothetical protein
VNSPFEIEEYFDKIESTKAMSILKMIENEISKEKMFESIVVLTILFQFIVLLYFKAI